MSINLMVKDDITDSLAMMDEVLPESERVGPMPDASRKTLIKVLKQQLREHRRLYEQPVRHGILSPNAVFRTGETPPKFHRNSARAKVYAAVHYDASAGDRAMVTLISDIERQVGVAPRGHLNKLASKGFIGFLFVPEFNIGVLEQEVVASTAETSDNSPVTSEPNITQEGNQNG